MLMRPERDVAFSWTAAANAEAARATLDRCLAHAGASLVRREHPLRARRS